MKRIGIDARFYGEAGPGRYVKNIVLGLEEIDSENEYYIFLKNKDYDSVVFQNKNFKKIKASYSWYSFEEQFFFLIKLISCKLDLLYVPHFNIPIFYPFKMVTAIPDIIMHSFSTEEGTTLPKFYYKFKKLVYYLVVLIALVRSKKVIVPSSTTKNDIIGSYPFVNKNKFVLAYEGVDLVLPSLAHEDYEKSYLLFVSSMYKHKNVKRLIDAFSILIKKYGYAGNLILVGKKDYFSSEIEKYVVENKLEERVFLPGQKAYVSDEETSRLRKNAQLFVFPSLKEGFSLTPLEAMASGLCCVISDIPCHREVFGDSVFYFNPLLSEEIAKSIDTVLKNPQLKEELIKKGYECVKKYNWNKTALITLDVFKQVL